jgi:CubicO group peptidase (beta-lactamase class C family)
VRYSFADPRLAKIDDGKKDHGGSASSIRSGWATRSTSVPPEKISRVVTAHTRLNGALSERPNPAAPRSTVAGDGGLFSDARDYGLFMRMWLQRLHGGRLGAARLVKESTVRKMISNQIGRVVVETQARPAE